MKVFKYIYLNTLLDREEVNCECPTVCFSLKNCSPQKILLIISTMGN